MRKLKSAYGYIGLISRSKNTFWVKEYVSPDYLPDIFIYAFEDTEYPIWRISWRRYKKRLQKESDSLRID